MKTVLFILIVIAVFYFYKKKKKDSKIEQPEVKTPEPQPKSLPKPKIEQNLYKKKGIKNFNIVGIKHYIKNLQEYKDTGIGFSGYIQNVKNSHDKYAVGVFKEDGTQIGHIPKNNTRLFESLKEWYEGKNYAWGHIGYDEFERKWYSTVFSPIGFSSEEIEMIKNTLLLIKKNKVGLDKKDKNTEEYFQILERHREIEKDLKKLKNPPEIYYSFPLTFIPSVSKHLEKEKNWNRLIELEKYAELIEILNKQYKGATIRRIELAKSHKTN